MSSLVSTVKRVPSFLKGLDLTVLKRNSPDMKVVKQHYALLQSVQAKPYEVELVMGYLEHQPDKWVSVNTGHVWHSSIVESTQTLFRHELPRGEHIYLVHLQSRWMLVATESAEGLKVIPTILLFTDQPRDGVSVSFYRIMSGVSLSRTWMNKLTELVQGVLDIQEKPEPELPSYTLPIAGLHLG